MGDESHARFSQGLDDFAFYSSRDGDAAEGAVDGLCTVEYSGLTFFEEVCWIGRFRRDEVDKRGE